MILTLHSSMHTQIHAEAGDNGKGVTRSNVHPLTPREGEGEEQDKEVITAKIGGLEFSASSSSSDSEFDSIMKSWEARRLSRGWQ